MDEFENDFVSEPPAASTNGDVDPAAEFLAREQHQLAGLDDDLEPAGGVAPVTNFPDENDDDAFPAPAHAHPAPPKEEPEKIRKWREEQKLRLDQKDADEEVRKQEMREAAKKELQDWYTNHEEQIAKTRAANRSAEKQFVAESDEVEPGTEWERIAKLCDFNPKSAKSSKDVSRMRSIILQLKQSGLTTPKKA